MSVTKQIRSRYFDNFAQISTIYDNNELYLDFIRISGDVKMIIKMTPAKKQTFPVDFSKYLSISVPEPGRLFLGKTGRMVLSLFFALFF